MYRIRLHGRGGQGMKTAGRILGTAFFALGYEVQDAPRYGAERRGAPMFAYVRADEQPIHERGVIHCPDLVIVADDSLVPIAGAGVLGGIDAHTVLLLDSDQSADVWRHRLHIDNTILTLPVASADRLALKFVGAACAGAAARLLGVISAAALTRAVREELAMLGEAAVEQNLEQALSAFERMSGHAGCVSAGAEVSAADYRKPEWIELPFEDTRVSAPAIHAVANSVQVRTGLWRTQRPVIDYQRCNGCWWVCGSVCPDGAIDVDERGRPRIDYEHCKGCMICVAQCPPHAIAAIPEQQARHGEGTGEGS